MWFERQVDHPTALPVEAREAASRYRYVFVAGFLNEGFRLGYFYDNRKALLEAGIRPDAIHVIFPRSGNGVEENVALLRQSIPDLAARGPQKLVLIAHSKGAVEALAFVAAAPAFVRDRVQAVFLVQGAFGGTSVADYVAGGGHPLDDRMPVRRRVELAIAVKGGKLLDPWIDDGVQSLTHRRAGDFWNQVLPAAGAPGATSRLPQETTDKIFFVRSLRDPDKVSTLIAATASYLHIYYGDNDGLLEVNDQWIAGTGQILATLDADHFTLTIARPVSNQPSRTRRAFTRGLLMQVAGAFGP